MLDSLANLAGYVVTERRDAKTGLLLARKLVKNTILNTTRSKIAKWLTNTEAVVYPDYIGLGRGSATEYHSTNQDALKILNTTTQQQLAQGVQVAAAVKVQKVALYLQRVGSPTGNMTVEIQTDSAGSPSGTVITNGTSQVVLAATPSTTLGWVNFDFSTFPSLTATTQYHLIFKCTSYVYSAGVNEIKWGIDESSPGYANGQLKTYDGATWSNASPAADGIFSVVQANEATVTALAQPINYDGANAAKVVDSNLIQSIYDARKVVVFTASQGNDMLREVGLFDAANSGNLWARAVIDELKASSEALVVYWILRVQATT